MELLDAVITVIAVIFGAMLGIKRIGLLAVVAITGLIVTNILDKLYASIKSAINSQITLALVIVLIVLALMFAGFSLGLKILAMIGLSGNSFEKRFSESTAFVIDKVLGAGFALICCFVIFTIITGN